MQGHQEKPWVIVEINHQAFALSAGLLQQIIMLPEVTAVPELPGYIRGVIHLRGRVVPLIDLRRRMGMATVAQEIEDFCRLMDARENDHRNWLNELQASIRERRPFRLTTDPHQCAFGRWYDCYQPPDPWLGALLKKFVAPHQTIHALAAQVQGMQDQGSLEQAARRVHGTGVRVLGEMIRLFAELRALVRCSRRETVAVLTLSNRWVAVTVDLAVAVERLTVEELPAATRTGSDGMIRNLGKRSRDQGIALIVEPDRILDPGTANILASM